jgi:amidase
MYQLLRPLHELLNKSYIVLTPALAQLPLAIGQLKTDDEFNSYLQKNTEFSPFTSIFNQAGLPAMSIPILFHNQLPVSIQMGAAKGKDLLLFSLAKELQLMLRNVHEITSATSIPSCRHPGTINSSKKLDGQ